MKKMLVEQGLADSVQVVSRATSREEIWGDVGNPIYAPAAAELRRRGVPYDSGKRAEQLTAADCLWADVLIGMDDNNMRNMRRMYANAGDKMHKLLDYCGGGNVADPWYTDDFATAYRDIERGCAALLASMFQ